MEDREILNTCIGEERALALQYCGVAAGESDAKNKAQLMGLLNDTQQILLELCQEKEKRGW